ncbi:hypothetical protein ACX3YG_13760 [Pseudomonas wadenswilerensis]
MDSQYWSSLTIVFLYTAVSLFLLFRLRRAKVAYRDRTQASIDAGFAQTLSLHGLEQAQVLQDLTKLGRLDRLANRPFEVHRILHAPPDRWYLYLHTANSEPVLTEISELRAQVSIKSPTRLFGWRL